MEKIEPSFYAVIPANVRYDNRLTPNAKLLYGEITALANKTGYCWSTNKYFADLYSVSATSISKWIGNLIEFGYVKSDIIYKEGSKEILDRYLSLVGYPPQEKLNTPPQEKLKDNTTVSNITINNTSLYPFFIKHINTILHKKYRETDSVLKKFNARIKQGATIDEFVKAVNNASKDQFHRENGYKYLTPEFFSRPDKLEMWLNAGDGLPIDQKPKTDIAENF